LMCGIAVVSWKDSPDPLRLFPPLGGLHLPFALMRGNLVRVQQSRREVRGGA